MARKHIITLSGRPGSGKSSTSDRVAELLEYTQHSTGDLVRETTKKQKITLREYNKNAEENPDIDQQVDEELRKLRDSNDIVIDSRLGFYWIPESFKVYLWLDNEVAIARIFKDANLNINRSKAGEGGSSMDDVIDQVEERSRSEKTRFKKMYGVDPFDTENFDLVIDTSRHSPQTVALTIFDTYQQWLKTSRWKRVVSKVPLGYSLKNDY